MSDGYELSELVSAIRDAIGVPLVTKWILVAEVIDEDGDKALCELHDDALAIWDAVGLLTFQLAVEKQRLTIAQED